MSIQRNKEAMKRFETMINTCDGALAEELVDPGASFSTPASSVPCTIALNALQARHWNAFS